VLSQTTRRNDHKNTFVVAEEQLDNLTKNASSIMHEVRLLLEREEGDDTDLSLTSPKTSVDAKFVKIKEVLDRLKEVIGNTRDLSKWDLLLAKLNATLLKRRCSLESNMKKCTQLEQSDSACAHELRGDCKDLRNIEENLR
jgi:hypothetical protein